VSEGVSSEKEGNTKKNIKKRSPKKYILNELAFQRRELGVVSITKKLVFYSKKKEKWGWEGTYIHSNCKVENETDNGVAAKKILRRGTWLSGRSFHRRIRYFSRDRNREGGEGKEAQRMNFFGETFNSRTKRVGSPLSASIVKIGIGGGGLLHLNRELETIAGAVIYIIRWGQNLSPPLINGINRRNGGVHSEIRCCPEGG